MNTFLLINYLLIGQTIENPASFQNTWKTQEESDFIIQYPDDWELNKSGQMGTSLILFSPSSSDQDKFRENVTVIIQDLKGMDIDLDKYVEISESQFKTMATDGVLLESKRLKSSDIFFHKILYNFKQGIFMVKVEQYYFIKNEKAYVITLTAEMNQFDIYKEIGEKILNSFKVKS